MNSLYNYKKHIAVLLLGVGMTGWAFSQEGPRVGYVYPAGVQAGTSAELTIGGRGLGNPKSIVFNRAGIEVEVIEHVPNAKRKYASYLRQIGAIYKKAGKNDDPDAFALLQEQARQIEEIKVGAKVSAVPQDASFRRLPELSLEEFREVAEKFRMMESVQTNAEISELLKIRVTVAADVPLGPCEMRVSGRSGLSNPMNFHVGALQEHLEAEPNDQADAAVFDAQVPFLINGQVMPGDVDQFRFAAKQGQGLVLQARARELIPFLADAVPGWFQATLRVLDAEGGEVAYVDDFEYRPDPVLYFEVPEDGVYTVEIRDAIYRGREDFVYRLEIGETPFVTAVFPLGATLGEASIARVSGWNLPTSKVKLNTNGEYSGLRGGTLPGPAGRSNPFLYAVGTAPVRVEGESVVAGGQVALGETVAGLISVGGERDTYLFAGDAGQKIRIEVRARRLGSPLDSRLILFAPGGGILAEADNLEPENHGLHTDPADSLLEIELPESGVYRVELSDVQARGGDDYGYLLDTRLASPDFELVAYPSGLSINPGGSRLVSVKAFRRSGFEGPIRISLGKEAQGFRLSGGVIPAGEDTAEMVISAGQEVGLYNIKLFGVAQIEDRVVRHRAQPCEAAVQAFITHHFVDTSSFVVEVSGRRVALPRAHLAGASVELLEGGTADLRLGKPKGASQNAAKFEFALTEACRGVSIQEIRDESDAYVVSLKCDPAMELRDGWLVVQCFALRENNGKTGKPKKVRRVFVGALPAIPFHVNPGENS